MSPNITGQVADTIGNMLTCIVKSVRFRDMSRQVSKLVNARIEELRSATCLAYDDYRLPIVVVGIAQTRVQVTAIQALISLLCLASVYARVEKRFHYFVYPIVVDSTKQMDFPIPSWGIQFTPYHSTTSSLPSRQALPQSIYRHSSG